MSANSPMQPGEEAHIEAVVKASLELLDDTKRPVQRGQHPKMHGCVAAHFIVESHLSDEYRVGLFAEPGRSYSAWIRFSNGLQTDDRNRDAHGMAIKLVGVEGPKLLPDEAEAITQDFVLVDHPNFFIRDPAQYATMSRAMVRAAGKGSTSSPSLIRQVLFFLPDPARMLATLILIFFFPWRLATLAKMLAFAGSSPESPLTSRYWSTTPYRFGPDRVVKYAVRPEAGNLTPRPLNEETRSANYLRAAMVSELASREVVFIFQVQFARDERTTPVEDPTVEWLERDAPPVTLARIVINSQTFDTPAFRAFGDELSFTPWHALAAHEPLGGINRTRKAVYQVLSGRRHEDNGTVRREPTLADRPGDPVPTSHDPSGFGQVLEDELQLIHARRQTLFGPDDPAPEFANWPDEDRRIKHAREQALKAHVMGLSISGGGIRSGTFAVGIIQGLASVGILKRFDYLSTVSGGGYAGGWLAGWIQRAGSIREVEKQLDDDRRVQGQVNRRDIHKQVVDEEPEPLRHLRAFSSYLFPQPGMLKPDTWTVLLIWVRNVLINLGMLLPMALGAVALARLMVYLFSQTNQTWMTQDGPAGKWGWLVGVGFVLATLGCALLATTRGLRALDEFRFRNPAYRPEGTNARRILVPIAIAAVLLTLFARWLLAELGDKLARASVNPPNFVVDQPLIRFGWDYLGTHLDLFDPPNLALHILVIGGLMGGLATRAARRNLRVRDVVAADHLDPDEGQPRHRLTSTEQRRQVATLARASFVAAGFVAVLIVLLEVLIRYLGSLDRPDLMATFAPALAMLIFVGGMMVQVAILGRTIEEAEREWWARLSALLTLRAIFWSATLAAIFYLPGLLYAGSWTVRTGFASGWLATATMAVLSGRYVLPNLKNRLGGLSLTFLASVASLLFLAGFVGLVGLLGSVLINTPSLLDSISANVGTYDYYLQGVKQTTLPSALLLGFGSLVLYSVAVRLIDVNLFSLHAMYTNRLARCYLGASRALKVWASRWVDPRDTRIQAGAPSIGADHAPSRPRDPNPISGFDPADDLPLFDLRIGPTVAGQPRPFDGPQLLINATLNLVEGHDLAWRDRKGESFTLSPLYCGSKGLGYSRLNSGSRTNLTLGRAMAISGAAIDPNMSYYQSPPLTALLTIFNARLGYWIARPRPVGWVAAGPRFGELLITEFLGRTDGSRDYVHLSDGGHFENLGVYELVRRRCRYVVAVDAGSDSDPADDNLADLVRLCRIDFGVGIEVDTTPIQIDSGDGLARSHVVVGRINYQDLDEQLLPGILVYIKISLTGDEPADVERYARSFPTFPHQATDYRQAFDEAQFESYRCLGHHIARKVFESLPVSLLGDASMPQATYTEKVFDRLTDRWSAGTIAGIRPLDRYAAEWLSIEQDLADDSRLAALDRDLFPEIPASTDAGDSSSARAELHMVFRMLHLMQALWRELGLDRDATLPVNQGWMNTFRRWTGTEAARRLWPQVSSSFAPEFVRFCRDKLYLGFRHAQIVRLPLPADRRDGAGFEEEAVTRILEEFDREWPEPGGGNYLRSLIQAAGHVRVPDLPAWLVVQGQSEPAGRVACGIVLVFEEAADPTIDAPGIGFFVWVRRAFRSVGIARNGIHDAIREAQEALILADIDPTLTARYPLVDPDDTRRADWVRYHAQLGFQADPLPSAEPSTVLRLTSVSTKFSPREAGDGVVMESNNGVAVGVHDGRLP